MIKAIIFDCFGVLTTDRWLEYCSTIENQDIREQARQLNYRYDSGELTLDEFIEKVQTLTGSPHQVFEDIFRSPMPNKNAPLIGFIRELKKDYKIGILSNVATNWVREVLLDDEEQGLFEAMVFSYEIGAGKPDPIMYTTILDRLGAKPHEAVFIDDLERYCQGAEALGIKTIRYENFEQMKKKLVEVLGRPGSDN